MKPTEVIRIAWEAILKNKVRAFLTMLGIIIGVAAVIMMIAISKGTEATIQEQITASARTCSLSSPASRAGDPEHNKVAADWSSAMQMLSHRACRASRL